MKQLCLHALLLVALAPAALARDFAMPPLVPAARLAVHDAHAQEKATAGAEAYDTAEKAALFHASLLRHSVLPVRVVFTNDGDTAIDLRHVRFELVTRDRAKASPYSLDDLRRALTAIVAPGSRPVDQLPLPLPGRNKAHGGVSKRDMEELEKGYFDSRTVEPHSSVQGFLFFDVSDLESPAQGARLYITGVSDDHGHQLMYFELALGESPRP